MGTADAERSVLYLTWYLPLVFLSELDFQEVGRCSGLELFKAAPWAIWLVQISKQQHMDSLLFFLVGNTPHSCCFHHGSLF